MTTLEQKARKAAEQELFSPDDRSYRHGYLAAAKEAEQEIVEMKLACRGWERSAAESESVVLACEGKIARQEQEIASLRAKLNNANKAIVHFTKVNGNRIFDRDAHSLMLDHDTSSAIFNAHNKGD